MNFEAQPLNFGDATFLWAQVFGVCLALGLLVGLIISLALNGAKGFARFFDGLGEGIGDIIRISFRRVWALTMLTVKEAVRRKALLVFVVFAILFMFGGWFLSNTNTREDLQLSVYVSFVLTAMSWLIFPVALILSCWAIPEDIRLRSLHTVVTKPVRRSEIVVGRVLGFTLVGTMIVGIMSVIGYFWIMRQVPERVKARLVARVPVYGSLSFTDREGALADKGINTGDINEYRSYVEGATKAKAIWLFDEITDSSFQTNAETGEQELVVENSFQAFRTHKGDIGEVLYCEYTLVNPDTDLRVALPQFPVYEFEAEKNTKAIPRKLKYYDEKEQRQVEVDLLEDLVAKTYSREVGGETFERSNALVIEARCVDVGQFLGMAAPDLFVRLPDRNFAVSYFKSVSGVWMMMFLIILLGVTASTFVKGPVATLLLLTIFIIGTGLHPFLNDMLSGELKGTGMLESGIRIINHGNPNAPNPEGIENAPFVQSIDRVFTGMLRGFSFLIPNFNTFSFSAYTAHGFDVPLETAIIPAAAVIAAFLLPCFLLGYFALKLRELESK